MLAMTITDAAPTSAPATDLVDELRTWLEENWDPDLTVGEWWERLGLAGWAAPTLPDERLRPGPVPQRRRASSNARSPRSAPSAPRPGSACCSRRPTIATHGTQEQIDTLRPRHRHRPAGLVPALQRAGRRLRPRRPHGQGGPGRRRVDRQRPEGLDLAGPDRRHGHAPRPHRPRRAEAPGHHLVRHRHAPARRRGPARCGR